MNIVHQNIGIMNKPLWQYMDNLSTDYNIVARRLKVGFGDFHCYATTSQVRGA
jgi:hypothetical protein